MRSLDEVMENDAEWFKNHPGVREYIRPYEHNEFEPLYPVVKNPCDKPMVKVHYVDKGLRIREPLTPLVEMVIRCRGTR
jgi:hypothetical protein